MTASPSDRRRMAVVARDLAAAETDEPATGPALERAIADANADRARHGRPPLADEPVPEEQLYVRARALRLRRVRG